MEERSTPPTPIIDDGILLEESLLLISAEKKVGKSMLGYNIAIAISEGINFAFFKVPKPRSVLYMTAEGGQYPNEERIRKMGDCKNFSNENLTVVFNPKTLFDDEEKLEEFKALLDDVQPEVVIVDPLIRFHQQDENSSSGMTKIFGILRALMEEYSFALIIIHHLGKDGSRLARGSSAILGEYDSSIVLSKNIRSKRITCTFDMRHVRT